MQPFPGFFSAAPSKAWPGLTAGIEGLLQLIWPRTCWNCRRFLDAQERLFCKGCRDRFVSDPFPSCPACASTVGPHLDAAGDCTRCRGEKYSFSRAFRLGPYEGLLRELVLRIKQRNGEGLGEAVAEIWAEEMENRLGNFRPDIVIPVPLHWKRRWRRGFNQSRLTSQALAARLEIPCRPDLLRRIRATPDQVGEDRAARWRNVRGAFEALEESLTDKKVLLVDDVLTTGATASEAAKALAARHPAAIAVAVLGRA